MAAADKERYTRELATFKSKAAAGGESWTRPKTLSMDGYGVFYRDGKATRHERHTMYRVEEMHAAEPLWFVHILGQLIN